MSEAQNDGRDQEKTGQSKFSAEPAAENERAQSEVSDRKKEANRENSKRSTGPKSDVGKSWVRHNALRHGLYASDVVIRHGHGKEDQEEFDILLLGLRRAWKPRDVMQELLVRTIAESDWRLRRAARAEVGEIRRRTDTYDAREALNAWENSGVLDGTFWSREESKQGARSTALDIMRKIKLLVAVREDVEHRGYVSDKLQEGLDITFGRSHHLADQCHQFSYMAKQRQIGERESSSSDTVEGGDAGLDLQVLELEKKLTLQMLDNLMATQQGVVSELEQAEDRERAAGLLAHSLPPREFVDKLIRYETALVNKKEKAIKLLLRLQGK